jgi:hypothetical protein
LATLALFFVAKKLDGPLSDPAGKPGAEEEQLEYFRIRRDETKK